MKKHTRLHELATEVMADFDEETTGNNALDSLINEALAHKCDVNTSLLAACKALLSAMEMQEGREDGSLHVSQPNAFRLWFDAKIGARAAIMKAEGVP